MQQSIVIWAAQLLRHTIVKIKSSERYNKTLKVFFLRLTHCCQQYKYFLLSLILSFSPYTSSHTFVGPKHNNQVEHQNSFELILWTIIQRLQADTPSIELYFRIEFRSFDRPPLFNLTSRTKRYLAPTYQEKHLKSELAQ